MNPEAMLSMINKVASFLVGPDKAKQGCNAAMNMFSSGNYSNSKEGMMKALIDRNVSRAQFNQIAGYLNHPWAQKANQLLGGIMPGMTNALSEVTKEISAEYDRQGTNGQSNSANTGVNNEFPPLRKR